MGQLSIDMQMRGPLGLRDRLDLDREFIYLKATDGMGRSRRLDRLKSRSLN